MTNFRKIVAQITLVGALGAIALPASAQTSVSAACSMPNAPAALVSASPIDVPKIAADYGLSGSAVVEVDLDQTGLAKTASILKSSGWPVLDAAAQNAALAQRYTPEIRECRSIGGSYRLLVDF